MPSGFNIDRNAIRKMTREIQREFDKHPIKVPVHAEPEIGTFPTAGTTIYNGPVFQGDMTNARIAWGNRDVVQGDAVREEVAPGYEVLAELLTRLIQDVPALGLSEEEALDATTSATEALAEIVQEQPDRGRVRNALNVVKGVLSTTAMKAVSGAGDGASELAKEYVNSLQLPGM